MNSRRIFLVIGPSIIVLLLLVPSSPFGCFTVTEPACPEIKIPEGNAECSTFCNCTKDGILGKAFRMTRIEVDEPEQFAGLLNKMWESDIANNVLNVLFVVDDVAPGTASAFNSITFMAGPAWRDPKEPLVLAPATGQPSESAVNSYCFLEGLPVEVDVKPYHGNQCTFKSATASSLRFHSGPMDEPVVCAPKIDPVNNIPLKDLKVRFNFNKDCTTINNGYMEGCILIEDANKICMCIVTGTCKISPTHRGYDPNDMSAYCENECGESWASFGEIVKAFDLSATCIMPDGKTGYRLQGFFDARMVPDKYNPVQSRDCMKH